MKPLPQKYDHKATEKKWQESWEEQKTYVEKYFGKGHHPNKQGHLAIAEKIIGSLNA